MSCLYTTDYGAPDPGFDALADHGRLIKGFESHRAALTRAQNLGQLQAMERKFAKGDSVAWCDNGYGWVYDAKVGDFFGAIVAFVILPWLVMRVAPAAAERLRLSSWPRRKGTLP
jgi:hypothetical protein